MLDLPKKKHEEHENHERWLVSYADFITLLFAFFVVMYASSNNNPSKMKELEESLRETMALQPMAGSGPSYEANTPINKSIIKNPEKPKNDKPIDELAGNVGDPALETLKHEMQRNKELQAAAEADRLQKNLAMISEYLKTEIENHQVVMENHDQDIILFIDTRITFEDGLAQVKKDFDPIMTKIATVLDQINGKVKVSGHSGSERLPASSRYQNQLELSSARATQFASSLLQMSKTLENRTGVESFGSTRPVNKSGSVYQSIPDGRIEITIYQK